MDNPECKGLNLEQTLQEIFVEIDKMNPEDVNEYIEKNMQEDKKEIIKHFKLVFEDRPLDDPVRLRVVKLLSRLFIEPEMLI